MNERRKRRKLIYSIAELMNTSESSSDEEILKIVFEQCSVPRAKIENYMCVVANYSEEQFRQTFRVGKHVAAKLSTEYGKSTYFPRTCHGGKEVIPAYNQILSFLWFAGNKCCVRDVAERFGIGISTFYRQQMRIIEFLVALAPQIITFPKSEEEKRSAANKFFNIAGFPNVIGCIDGTHIPIRSPALKIKSTYTNRHDTPSMILQGICSADKRFIDVFTGPPGKIHDARVFHMSFIAKEIAGICEETYHLLGDSAYPIRQYLITPYRDYGNLDEQKKKFNKALSATRVKIENTFGLLKGRWRQLLLLDFHDVEKMAYFVMSCCVLHNLCIASNDVWDEQEADEREEAECIIQDSENDLRQLGELKRAEICRSIND